MPRGVFELLGSKLLNALAALHRIYYNTSDILDDGYECECGHHHPHTHGDEEGNFYQKRQSAWLDDEEDADRWL